VNYDAWERTVPEAIKADSLWKMTAYRLALFLTDLGWRDLTRLNADQRTKGLSDQLYRAIGSISPNLSEGHSRGTGKARARFYEYALGSACESRDCYFKARHILGDTVADHRLEVLTEVIRRLLTMVPQQHRRTLREQGAQYLIDRDDAQPGISIGEKLDDLLRHIPLPDP
jgi:four helix bundle protein